MTKSLERLHDFAVQCVKILI